MIFKDIMASRSQIVQPEFENMFDLCLKNQVHSGDLLLVGVNGFYNPDVHNWVSTGKPISPYLIGPDKEGWSDQFHYEFINIFRKETLLKVAHPDYLKLLNENKIKSPQEYDEMLQMERYHIQMQMLIYLKIWEGDKFIKVFYQLARLLNGTEYDWHFKIKESNRDISATGVRHKIIRQNIRDQLMAQLPILHQSFKLSYSTQIRNSIAHSKYSFLDRNIHLNNYVENDPASQIRNLPFDKWIEIFHETMIVYNGYIYLLNNIIKYYGNIAQKNNGEIEIKINRKDPRQEIQFHHLIYRKEWNDFHWKNNE